jgi:hypothetical protein
MMLLKSGGRSSGFKNEELTQSYTERHRVTQRIRVKYQTGRLDISGMQ